MGRRLVGGIHYIWGVELHSGASLFAFPKKLPQPSDQLNFDVATEAAESLDVVDIEAEREVDVTSAVDRQRTSDPTEHDERASVAEQICAESKCSSIKGNFYLCAKGYFIFIAVI